ncbi:hypothetical protein [Aquimarina agarivorans]|uniref:hypothetical protein n=1 Tax=Aquimarina agarivorans TaxID=980584 RepID=UPI000248E943|nr:hypothetical protein [Aquimarina agarivorans]
MNVEATKLQLMQSLLAVKRESFLERLQSVFDEEFTDLWSELTEEEQKGIEEGLAQADQGKFVSDEQAMKRFSKWH